MAARYWSIYTRVWPRGEIEECAKARERRERVEDLQSSGIELRGRSEIEGQGNGFGALTRVPGDY